MQISTKCLQYGSAFFAFAAALLWFLSAVQKIPRRIERIDGGTLDGAEKFDDQDQMSEGLWRQSCYSAFAATSAGIAALLQALAINPL